MSDFTEDREDRELTNEEKLKNDKIFNSRYKLGEGLKDEDYEYQSSIEVNSNYSDNYLKDIYDYEDTLDYNIGVSKIFDLIHEDAKLSKLLERVNTKDKIKLSKEEINELFSDVINLVKPRESEFTFYSPIYVLEVVSSILSINSDDPIKDYKKIFDCLDVNIQGELLLELNKKFKILEGKMNKGKIY